MCRLLDHPGNFGQQYLNGATAATSLVQQQPRITSQNGWTVEEQIYKSKMWLKQRNQSMLSKP